MNQEILMQRGSAQWVKVEPGQGVSIIPGQKLFKVEAWDSDTQKWTFNNDYIIGVDLKDEYVREVAQDIWDESSWDDGGFIKECFYIVDNRNNMIILGRVTNVK